MLGEISSVRRGRFEEEWLLLAPLPVVLAACVFVFALFFDVFRLIAILPFNIIRLRWRKEATQGSSVDSFHQQYLFAVVSLVQLDFDNFTVRGLNRASDKACLDRQFPMSAVN